MDNKLQEHQEGENAKQSWIGGVRDCTAADMFQCTDGQGCVPANSMCSGQDCSPGNWMCDGIKDCGDGSDENFNCSSNFLCDSASFTCTGLNNASFRTEDQRCIPFKWKCDDYNDCEDGTDEQHCG
ncbi:unnamed protein product, partial [Meganyctiphanes norvegica]